MKKWFGKQLCRIGLHKWEKSKLPVFDRINWRLHIWKTCQRPGCNEERHKEGKILQRGFQPVKSASLDVGKKDFIILPD